MNLIDVLQSNNIKVLKGAGAGEIRFNCLFCIERGETEDTRQRLGLNTNTGLAQCWNCGWSSRKAIAQVLRKLSADDVQIDKTEEGETEDVVTLPEGFEYLKPGNKRKSWYHKKALRYLRLNRGLPDWQIEAKKIGVTIIGRFAYRIIFPVVFKKELVGIVGREFTGTAKPKYLNSVGDKYLYNCPQDRNGIKTMILSEGIFKALKIERVALKSSVSLLGHSITPIHFKQLKRYKNLRSVIVWPDPDKVGIKGTCEVCAKLVTEGYNVTTLYPIPTAQADELTDKDVKIYLERTVPYTPSVDAKMRTHAAFL